MGKVKAGILGASGYSGAELLKRLAAHPEVEVAAVGSRQYQGEGVATCWPHLAGRLPGLRFEGTEEVIAASDVLLTATPHGATAGLVKQGLDAGCKVVDLSADYRLASEDYRHWYGLEHPHPELLPEAFYGLVELHRSELHGARLIANPGCNATAASLALAPLAACGLLGQCVTVNILTGVSGAGRLASLDFTFGEVNENVRPYKAAGGHRHIAEVETTLGRVRRFGRQVRTHARVERPAVNFNPHLVPMSRGILATCTTQPERLDGTLDDARLLERYQDFYAGEPLINVQQELPQTKAVAGTDRTFVSARFDSRSEMIVAFAAIDNLGKGAAGQAVQNMNVMLGFDELAGLELGALWP